MVAVADGLVDLELPQLALEPGVGEVDAVAPPVGVLVRVERIVLQQGLVLEVKWLDADEYPHWRRDGVDFTNTRPCWSTIRSTPDGNSRSSQSKAFTKVKSGPIG